MKLTSEVVYAFIDYQNLNLGIKSLGWKLDFERFRVYIAEKYKVQKVYLFLGYIKENEILYKRLKSFGYEIIFKPTVKYKRGSGYTVKGNIDIELAIQVLIEIENFDKCLIISGDGDFYSLVNYIFKKNKLYKILVPNSKYSTLLKRFSSQIVNLEYLKNKLEKK
jgi:uncharacterized LabA/DUF88 family protein